MARGQRWPAETIARWAEQWWASDLTSDNFVQQHCLPISGRALRDHAAAHFKGILRELERLRAIVGQPPSGEPQVCLAAAEAQSEPIEAAVPEADRHMASGAVGADHPDFFSFDLDLE